MATVASSDISEKRTYYDVLNISTLASQDEIKRAYRSLVVRCHPDKLALTAKYTEIDKKENHEYSSRLSAIDLDDDEEDHDDETENDHYLNEERNEAINAEHNISSSDATTEEELSTAAKAFQEIHTAYECLRDSEKRMRYDQTLSRDKEKKEWKKNGAIEVNLSDLESDMCCVLNDDDDESDWNESKNHLQKVYFHDCRCGHTFEILEEEILESMRNEYNIFQCESCSLGIRIILDGNVVR